MPRLQIKTRVRQQPTQQARYAARWINGVWTVFDRLNFNHGLPLGTGAQANRVAAQLNEGKLQWAART